MERRNLLKILGLGTISPFVPKLLDNGLENLVGSSYGLESKAEAAERYDLKRASKSLENYGWNLSPEDLVYLTRLLYFESWGNGKDIKEIRKGLEGVMYVIVNRWKFDNNDYDLNFKGSKIKTGYQRFGGGTLMSIVEGKSASEFSAIGVNKKHFQKKNFRDDWLVNTSNPTIQNAMDECYQAVLRVLKGEAEDPTDGALFYKNPRTAKSNFPCHRCHAGAISKTQKEDYLQKRSSRNYVLNKSAKIGQHVFYNVLMKEYQTVWDNKNQEIAYFVDGRLVRKVSR